MNRDFIGECLEQLSDLLTAAKKCQKGQVPFKVRMAREQLLELTSRFPPPRVDVAAAVESWRLENADLRQRLAKADEDADFFENEMTRLESDYNAICQEHSKLKADLRNLVAKWDK